MSVSITPVILCGGSGTRLWPRSRASAPKPLLPLLAEGTLFGQALKRCRAGTFQRPVVVTGEAQLPLVKALAAAEVVAEIIVEPVPRQTAAAVALAALRLPADAVMLVCPSDHYIGDVDAFRRAAAEAAVFCRKGWLVCLGIPPAGPEDRFGYLRKGAQIEPGFYRVDQFVEKPNAADAAVYVGDGGYFWNSGIFAMRAGDYLDELRKYRPEIAVAARMAVASGELRGAQFDADEKSLQGIVPESIDYAVMEHSEKVAMVIADKLEWSDVGDWQTVHQLRESDSAGNSVRGPAELLDCRDILVDSDGPKVHAIGLQNVVIVVDGDDILVADASSASKVSVFGRADQ